MTLKIYHGTAMPFRAIGKNQCRLLQFAFDHPAWHYYNAKCRATMRAINALSKRGCIVTNAFGQFKINMEGVNK